MRMNDNRISTRYKARTLMLLDELSKLTHCSLSVLVRMLVERGLDQLLDEEGNFQLRGTRYERSEDNGQDLC